MTSQADDGFGYRRWWALAVIGTCVLLPFVDMTVVTIALTDIARDIHASSGQLQWVIASYILTSAVFMLVVPKFGSIWGYRRTLLAGLAVFGVASAGASLAHTPALLIVMRAFMGVGASVVIPMGMAIIGLLFQGEEQRKAMGMWTAGVALATPAGPIVGGVVLDNLWWGWIFLINVVMVAVVVPLGLWLLPEARGKSPTTVDLWSVVLIAVGMAMIVYGLVDATYGWFPATVWIVLGVGIQAAFLYRQAISKNPLMRLAVFRAPRFIWGQLTLAVTSFAWTGILLVVPMYMRVVVGLSALDVGVRLVPFFLLGVLSALVADRSSRRFGARWVVVAGLAVFGGGLALLPMAAARGSDLLVTIALTAAGFAAITQAPALWLAMSALPPETAANGSGFVNSFRHMGGAIGAGVIGSAVASSYVEALPKYSFPLADSLYSSVANAQPVAATLGGSDAAMVRIGAFSAFVHGMTVGVWIAVGAVTAVGLLVCLLPDRATRITQEAGQTHGAPQGANVLDSPIA